jgi:hypothetical protein
VSIKRWYRRNQLAALLEEDVILTVGGALLFAGLVYVVAKGALDGLQQGWQQGMTGVKTVSDEQSTEVDPGGSDAALPQDA